MKDTFVNLDTDITFVVNNNKLLNLLKNLGIKKVGDLLNYELAYFADLPAIGKLTISRLKEVYDFIEDWRTTNYDVLKTKEKLSQYLDRDVLISPYSDNKKLQGVISLEEVLDIYSSNLSVRDKINVSIAIDYLLKHLTDIYNNDYTELLNLSDNYEKDLEPFNTISPSIAKYNHYSEAFEDINLLIDSLGEKLSSVIKMRYGIIDNKKTLEEIGKKLNITRERVRQLEKQGIKKLFVKLKDRHYKIINTFYKPMYCPSDNPLLEIICEYLVDINQYIKKSYLESTIYIKKERENDVYEFLNYIISELEESGNLDLNLLKDKSEYIQLFSNKYVVKDGIAYSKNNLKESVPIIMKKLDGPINLGNSYETKEFYKMLEEECNVTSEYANGRNIERIISECSILYGPKTYIDENLIGRLENIEEIFEYIENNKITNSNQVYEIFKNDWNNIKIYNQFGAYGYLKYFYPDKYNYAGRSMLISIIGEKTSWGEVVIDNVKLLHRPVSFEEIHKMYEALNIIIWNNLPNIFDDLIAWGNNCLYCKSEIDLNNDEMSIITSYIFENNKMVSVNDLFSYLMINHHSLLEKNNVSNEKQLKKMIQISLEEIVHLDPQETNFYV